MRALQMYTNMKSLAWPVSPPDLLYSSVSSQPQIHTPFRDTMPQCGTQERRHRRRFAPTDASFLCIHADSGLPIPVAVTKACACGETHLRTMSGKPSCFSASLHASSASSSIERDRPFIRSYCRTCRANTRRRFRRPGRKAGRERERERGREGGREGRDWFDHLPLRALRKHGM
jgi:hypothetical protein